MCDTTLRRSWRLTYIGGLGLRPCSLRRFNGGIQQRSLSIFFPPKVVTYRILGYAMCEAVIDHLFPPAGLTPTSATLAELEARFKLEIPSAQD